MRIRSLQTKVALLLGGSFLALWLLVSLFVYRDSHSELDRVFDAQLAQSAKLLLLQSSHEVRELHEDGGDLSLPFESEYDQHIAFQISEATGTTLIKSGGFPELTEEMKSSGFEDHQGWRIFSLSDREQGLVVRTAQRHELRETLAQKVALRLLWPLLLVVPLTALLAWLITRFALGGLNRLAREVGSREPHQLLPLDLSIIPDEVRPLIIALNELLSRVERTLAFERRFTSDAAHELRTPLAGIRVQAEIAGRSKGEEQVRALSYLVSGVDRMTRILNQLLLMARVEASDLNPSTEPVELSKLVGEVFSDLSTLALNKKIEFEVQGEGRVFQVNSELLSILIRNLIENSIRHTPANGQIQVQVSQSPQGPLLSIEDSGPGVPPDQIEKVFDAFYRGPNPEGEGSGLGLSIVKRIAERHGAAVSSAKSEKLGGLKVQIRFKA